METKDFFKLNFIRTSDITVGETYIAVADDEGEKVKVVGKTKDEAGWFVVEIEFEVGGSDEWYLAPEDEVFATAEKK